MNEEQQAVDILLYVAMKEEFNDIVEHLGPSFVPREFHDLALTVFLGRIPSPALGRECAVAVVPAGKMGNIKSASVTSALLGKFKPHTVVVVGIAGSLTDDLEPGDVFIPDSIHEYMANTATRSAGDHWTIDPSGNHFLTCRRLLNRFQFFEHTKKDLFMKWKSEAQRRRSTLITEDIKKGMETSGLMLRGESELVAGDDRKLASGPTVGKGKAFVDWIKRVDRKVVALEMESAGVFDAAVVRDPAPRALVIRGISDFADERKDHIERKSKGLFRRLSAQNAITLLREGIVAGFFTSETDPHHEGGTSGKNALGDAGRSMPDRSQAGAEDIPTKFDGGAKVRLRRIKWVKFLEMVESLGLEEDEFGEFDKPTERLRCLQDQLDLHNKWVEFWSYVGERYGIRPVTPFNVGGSNKPGQVATPEKEQVPQENPEGQERVEAPPPTPAPSLPQSGEGLREYLVYLAESYRQLKLQDISEAGTLRIDLEKVYVALKAEPKSEYDRKQAAQLHEVEVQESAGGQPLETINPEDRENLDAENLRRTHRPRKEEARRAEVVEVRTLGDAFRQYRRMVVLGGPGSGKTTLGRWLALQFARGLTQEIDTGTRVEVEVPRSQIDPARTSDSDGEKVNLGPARLPIFLRLAYFAKELVDRERTRQPDLNLIDYLGKDRESCSLGDGLTSETRNQLFRTWIEKEKQAIVILDGLDELQEANRRIVVYKIEDFIKQHIQVPAAKGEVSGATGGKSKRDDVPAPAPGAEASAPWQAGGNQVMVTSRYVGYEMAPVGESCHHFGVQSMQRPAVEYFARSWTAAVNAKLAVKGRERIVADELIEEIYDEARPAVRELATNPLMVTILATVYWAGGKLPDQRAGVYHSLVDNLLTIWLRRDECQKHTLTREELLATLEPLAADMQDNASSNGLVALERIGALAREPLAHMRGLRPNDRRVKEALDALLNTILDHVGLLAEQSPKNYSFFHRTFQEFLAARHLLADKAKAAAELANRMDEPLWREPLLLALGFAMIDEHWAQEERSQLLLDLLAFDGPCALIPRSAILIVTALPDLRDVSPKVIEGTTLQLLTSYAIGLDQETTPALCEQIEQTVTKLRHGAHAATVVQTITEVIRRPVPAGERDLSVPAAALCLRLLWFTTDWVGDLVHAVGRDSAALNWPIHRYLWTALGSRPGAVPWLSPIPQLHFDRLLVHLPMRRFLESYPETLLWVQKNTDWLWLMVALYGGLEQTQYLERLERVQEFRLGQMRKTPQPNNPEIQRATPEEPPRPMVRWAAFSPWDIVHDLPVQAMTRRIQDHLQARRPAAELIPIFKEWWNEKIPEALVALGALGEDVVPHLREALANPDREATARSALDRFSWLQHLIRESLVRNAGCLLQSIPRAAPAAHQLDLLRMAMEAIVNCGVGPLKISAEAPTRRLLFEETPAARAALDAEYWSYHFSGMQEKRAGSGAGIPDGWAKFNDSVESLLAAFSYLPNACNHKTVRRLQWPQPILAPWTNSARWRYLNMLDCLEGAPAEFDFRAGYLLGRCHSVADSEFLLDETESLIFIRSPSFYEGYWSGCALGDGSGNMRAPLDPSFIWSSDEVDWPENKRSPVRFGAMSPFDVSARVEEPWSEELFNAEGGDPHERLRSLERLLLFYPEQASRLSERIPSIVSRIRDPENRARAQVRLAMQRLGSTEVLLSDALRSMSEIEDPQRQAETLREVRACLGREPEMEHALDVLARSIPDPWLQAKSLARNSFFTHTYRRLFSRRSVPWEFADAVWPLGCREGHAATLPFVSLSWGLLHLHAVASELDALGSSAGTSGGEWARLRGPERAATVAAIVADGMERGVELTASKASTLDRLLQDGDADDLNPLWPILEQYGSRAVTVVNRWSARSDLAGHWLSLAQAEQGKFTAESVPRVIDLLSHPSDRLRCRAALALHGSYPCVQNKSRRWSVRRAGRKAVEAVARRATSPLCPRTVLNALSWIHHDLHHDDANAMEHWIAEGAASESPTSASWLVSHMESAENNVLEKVVQSLAGGTRLWQRSVLEGLARVSHCGHGLPEETGSTVAVIPPEIRADLRVLKDGPISILEVAENASRIPDPGSRVEYARQAIEEAQLTVGGSGENIGSIGGKLYVYIPQYWESTDQKAASLTENPDALKLLLDWFLWEREDKDHRFIAHMLTAIEALVRPSPTAFAVAADPHVWEPVLTDCAQTMHHWTGRMAAIRLLGRLRRVTKRVAPALRAAMMDVNFVQSAAYEAASEFRSIEGDILPDLFALLQDRSAGVAAATARLLTGVATSEGTASERKRILAALRESVAGTSIARPVYFVEEGRVNDVVRIRFVDTLDRIFYRAIFEISGM